MAADREDLMAVLAVILIQTTMDYTYLVRFKTPGTVIQACRFFGELDRKPLLEQAKHSRSNDLQAFG
jgi:hypothetical protein